MLDESEVPELLEYLPYLVPYVLVLRVISSELVFELINITGFELPLWQPFKDEFLPTMQIPLCRDWTTKCLCLLAESCLQLT